MTNSIVNITRYFMIVTGLWKIPLTQDKFLRKSYRVYSLTVLFIFTMITISSIIRMIELITGKDDPAKIYGCVSVTIVFSMVQYNVLIFLKRRIPFLFSVVIEEEIKSLNAPDAEIRSTYLNQISYYQMISACQIISTFSTAIMLIISTICKKINNSFPEGDVSAIEMWYPFDKTTHPYWVILANLILIIGGSFFIIASRISTQSLIIFVNAQLRILQIQIRKVFSNTDDEETILKFKVKKLIRRHQTLIRFVSSLNNSTKYVIFMDFILSSINVAAALLQVIMAETIFEMAYPSFHLMLLVLQIFTLAWSANEINIQSVSIANSVYESDWMNQSEDIKKIMFIMLMRAQKPLALTIGPFRPINLQSALITMRGAYTYASLMIQMYT